MGVDLRLVADTGGRKLEALDGPIQIMLPVRAPQRQAFAYRRLVDLDHPRSGILQIDHLVANGQRDLPAGEAARARRRARRTS